MDNEAFEELKAEAFKIYQVEVQDTMDSAERALLLLEESPTDKALINDVFRDLHTIKGSSAMNGVDKVAAFIHKLEDAYDQAREGELIVSTELVEVALQSIDYVRQLIDAGDDVSNLDQAVATAIQMRIDALVRGGQSIPLSAASQKNTVGSVIEDRPTHTLYHINFIPAANLMFRGTKVIGLLEEIFQLGACRVVADIRTVPKIDEIKPDVTYIGWRILVAFAGDQRLLDDVFIFVLDDCFVSFNPLLTNLTCDKAAQLVDNLYMLLDTDVDISIGALEVAAQALLDDDQKIKSEVENAALKMSKNGFESQIEKGNLAPESSNSSQRTADKSIIRVPADRLDLQLDLVGELVIAQSSLTEYSSTLKDSRLDVISETIERLTETLRDSSMSLRMLPVGDLFGRYKRVVRDIASRVGKQIKVTTEGEETELDKTVIDQLGGPLVHLIRNCADHGLETAQERIAAGKNPVGIIKLSASHEGANVLITVSDDGRGLNREDILARAESKGLLSPLIDYSDREIFQQILQPGFTTAQRVSDMSGRGVGMDVVKGVIEELRGTIEIQSQPGKGTQISMRMPLTLAIIDGLLVDVGGELFVLPLGLVEEVVELRLARGDNATESNILNIHGAIVPYLFLRSTFNITGRPGDIERVVIVTNNGARVGLVVDRIVGQHQTVVKSLGKAYENINNLSGTTILADGSVALILDVPDLVLYAENSRKLS